MILVSPTEPRTLLTMLQLAATERVRTHTLPEQLGADFLLGCRRRLVAVQRKSFPGDLVSSVQDGRLPLEVQLLQQVPVRYLLLEGSPTYTAEGLLMGVRGRDWTRSALRNLLRSVASWGVVIEWTYDQADTAATLVELAAYWRKPRHSAMLHRAKVSRKTTWGIATAESAALFFLQGLPGVGPTLAQALLNHFGGVPMEWTCALEDLESVEGIGAKRAASIYALLGKLKGGGK